jgi:hypothetical protein
MRRRSAAEIRKPGDLLGRNGEYLPQKVLHLIRNPACARAGLFPHVGAAAFRPESGFLFAAI